MYQNIDEQLLKQHYEGTTRQALSPAPCDPSYRTEIRVFYAISQLGEEEQHHHYGVCPYSLLFCQRIDKVILE
jgi:hypothetical protein